MPECVVVGAGFAGVGAAWGISRRGGDGVLVLERERAAGQHASGRNAGIVRTLIGDPEVQRLALASADVIGRGAEELGADGVFRQTGGVILGDGATAEALATAADRSRKAGRDVRESGSIEPRLARWAPAPPGRAFATDRDGVADIHALLTAFMDRAREAGIELRTGVEVFGPIVERGRVAGVRTSAGDLPARVVVNAAGAWAGGIGRDGVGPALNLVSLRRHLFTTAPADAIEPDLPFAWDDSRGYYFRPETGGFLLSACDESPHPPGDPAVDPAIEEVLAAKLVRHAPPLADLAVRHRWACLRTFAPDRRFVIGWDPVLQGLFWVAGLGGHGVTVSAAVADYAAERILAGPGAPDDGPFAPARFRTA